ncbi:condensation domain-containing protein [Micromonospora zhanjiangensis]
MSTADGAAATYPLSWGQAWPWLDQYRFPDRRTFDPVGFRVGLAEPGVPLGTATDALHRLCDRHESLRTRYLVAADGEPFQRIGDPALEYEMVRLPADADPAARERCVAEIVGAGYPPFDVTRSCGRAILVARGDRVLDVLVLLDHVAADVWGGDVLRRDLAVLLDPAPVAADDRYGQPRELAAEQSTEAGARRNRAGLAYWRRQMAAIPHTLFPEISEGRDTGRHSVHVARLRSPAAALALDQLAERYRVPASAVLLGAYAAVMSATTGFRTIGVSTVVNNRFSARRRNTVTSTVLPALASVEVDWADTVGSLLRQAAGAQLTATQRAECDNTETLLEGIRVQHQRGTSSDLIPQFNFVVGDQPSAAPGGRPPCDAATLARALADTRLTEAEEPWQNWIRLSAQYGPDLGEVTLHVPSRVRDRATTSALLRHLESLLVQQAGSTRELVLRTVPPFAGRSRPPLAEGWAWVDGCRIRPAAVRDLIATHPDVSRCAVRLVTEAGRATMHADVLARTADLDAVALHRWLMARLDSCPAAITPAATR